jgi:hypothetical protein
MEKQDGHGQDDRKDVDVAIQTTRGSKQFTFSKETKISEVIAKVVAAFGFAPGDHFQLVSKTNPGEPLKPERTLVSYGIKSGDVLILTAVGSGV